MQAAARKMKQASENIVLFNALHPEMYKFLKEKATKIAAEGGTFDFPAKMLQAVAKYGSLTVGQEQAVEKMMAREAQWQARQSAPPVEVDVSKISAAFDQARSAASQAGEGLKYLHLRMGNFVCSPAGANSRNPGSIYVKEDGTYLGKITDGKFTRSRECSDAQVESLREVARDPAEAARAYGLRTGQCSICGRELTREESRERGIGPICAGRFGFL